IGDTFKLRPLGKLNLKALLMQVENGHTTINLPLPRTRLEAGPLKVDLESGHEAIIELDVVEAFIERSTHGRIEPPIDLPLGAGFEGLYLDDNGDVKADLRGLPDVNLSRWVDAVPRIPESLDEALASVCDRPPRTEERKAPRLALSELRVEARGLTPRGLAPIRMGDAVEVMLGDGTLLDVEYHRNRVTIRGTAVLDGGAIQGEGFKAQQLSGRVTVAVKMTRDSPDQKFRYDVKASNLDLKIGELLVDLPGGGHFRIDDVRLDNGIIDLDTGRDERHLRVTLPVVTAQLHGGRVSVGIDGEQRWVEVGPLRIEGRVEIGDGVGLVLSLAGFDLRLDDVSFDFGQSP